MPLVERRGSLKFPSFAQEPVAMEVIGPVDPVIYLFQLIFTFERTALFVYVLAIKAIMPQEDRFIIVHFS